MKNNNLENLVITKEQRDTLVKEIGNLMKNYHQLHQAFNDNNLKQEVKNEELLLELLEIFDALESLLKVLQKNNQVNLTIQKRIEKNLATILKKILAILKKRNIYPIEFNDNYPDYNLCRVVEQEIRDDLDEKTIIKVIRQGFQYQDQDYNYNKILRPQDVIISIKSQQN